MKVVLTFGMFGRSRLAPLLLMMLALIPLAAHAITVRIDDVFKTEHTYLYGGIAAQTISFALMLAFMIQLAANGGMSTRHPAHLVDREKELANVRKGEIRAF